MSAGSSLLCHDRYSNLTVLCMPCSYFNSRFNQVTQCTDPDGTKRRFSEYFSSSLPTPDHIKYKYQLLIDGNTCTYPRAIWQLFSNSVVLKQSSDAVQWFYGALRPYEHYLPVNSDMSNLIDVIQWAIDHDDEALAISHRAQEFARDNLTQFRVMQ